MKKMDEQSRIGLLKQMASFSLEQCQLLRLYYCVFRLKIIEESLSNGYLPKCSTVDNLQCDLKNDCLGINYISKHGWVEKETKVIMEDDGIGYVIMKYVQHLIDVLFSNTEPSNTVDLRSTDSYYTLLHFENHIDDIEDYKKLKADGYEREAIRSLLSSFTKVCEKYVEKCRTWAKASNCKDLNDFKKKDYIISTFPTISLRSMPRADILQVRDGVSHNGYMIKERSVFFDLTHGELHYDKDVEYTIDQLVKMHDIALLKMDIATIMILFIQMSSLCHGNTFEES